MSRLSVLHTVLSWPMGIDGAKGLGECVDAVRPGTAPKYGKGERIFEPAKICRDVMPSN